MAAKPKSPKPGGNVPAQEGFSFEPMPKALSSTVKQKGVSRMDLSRTDLLQLLSYMEGELQARDVTIAALKMERVKHMVMQAKKGPLSASDPFAALQRDVYGAVDLSLDGSSLKNVYDNQLEKLEQLIVQQRKAMAKLTAHLKQAEKMHAKVVRELEEEKQKHEHDTAQGDDVTYALEKERTRLHQELEGERQAKKKIDKELAKVNETLEEEQSRQKQIVLLLLAERKKIIMKWIEERKRSEDLAQILAEEKGRVDSMAEGLEEESQKALQMEAELERLVAQGDRERQALQARLEAREKRSREIEVELEKARMEAENLHKQLAEAHQVAMFQAGQLQGQGHSPPRHGLGHVPPPLPPSKPNLVPPPPVSTTSPRGIPAGSTLPIPISGASVKGSGALKGNSLRSTSPNPEGVPSSVAKTVQPTASASSVPVSGPATGIAQSVKSVSGSATVGGGLRNAVFTGPILGDSLVSTPSVGSAPMSPRMNAGHPPTSTHSHTHTHLHNHPHTHTHALPPTSSGTTTESERGQMVQVSPRVAVSASPGTKVYTTSNTQSGKVTFHVTTTMAGTSTSSSRKPIPLGRGVPPPVPPNKPQVPSKKDAVSPNRPPAALIQLHQPEMTVEHGQPISFEVKPNMAQKGGQQALKFGITISKDKIHITNNQPQQGGEGSGEDPPTSSAPPARHQVPLT